MFLLQISVSNHLPLSTLSSISPSCSPEISNLRYPLSRPPQSPRIREIDSISRADSINPSMIRTVMWRNIAKQARAVSKNPSFRASRDCSCSSSSSSPTHSFLGIFRDFVPIYRFSIRKIQGPSLGFLRNQIGVNGVLARGFGSADEAVPVSSTEDEDDGSSVDEVQELIKEMKKAKKSAQVKKWRILRIAEMGMQDKKYQKLKRRQIQSETETWEQAANEYRELIEDMCSQKLAPNLPYVKSLFLGWCEPMRDAIVKERELIQRSKNKGHGKHFDLLPADKMALITMHRLMALMMSGGGSVRVVAAACSIGEAIENEVRIHNFLEKTKIEKDDKYESDTGIHDQAKLRKRVANLMKRQELRSVTQIVKGQDASKPWGNELRAKIGSRLIELLIETAYIQSPADQFADGSPDIRPAFVHTFISIERAGTTATHKKCGVIQCDPLILEGLDKTARHMVIPYMPMLVPPIKWTGHNKGAHFFLPSYVMRTHGSRQQSKVLKKTPKNQLKSVYEALDTLGSTRWRVNNRVLRIMEGIWNNGGCLAGLVDRAHVPLPKEPETDDEEQRKNWKWNVKSIKKENMERHSQCCDIELKLAVAHKMKNEEGFYYPHNVDFRGRAYPMHPYLNHLGSDLCRGILEFAEGRALGKSGLRWLKIHLANLYAGGVDKLSFEGRIAFTENSLDDIFDSADKPLKGRRWWLNAEDPFQCLAVCMNLTEALRSSLPETFVSHIPVHQDGSCNGLQYYAALGRDKLGAAAVNLIAGEKPADVYSGIAARVLDIMRRDAEKDPASFPEASNARILLNQVDRKLVKQTVMTSVYGVTYIGARDQIKKRLKECGLIEDDRVIFGAACYAAKVTLTAMGEMFETARCIMSWLGECAKIIASQNEAVCWTTPLGLPSVQPYCKLGRHLVKTSLQVLTLQHETNKVMVQRQKSAFPPNFIHSLDGSHMMMTAVACNKAGLNFAGVHDSFWTHACNVDDMNRLLREKFVELYETPILENLLDSFQQSFPHLSFPPLPERGDFDLRDVLESPYFFN